MNVDTELYHVFDQVAKEGTFSGAAKALGITQPAVSQSIKLLEDLLDVKLFSRTSRGVILTREGEELSGYVRSAMGLLNTGEERLSKLKNLSAGEIRIGAGDTVAKWFLLPLIEKYHAMYPDVKISLTNRTSDRTLELLKNGLLDIGFVNMPLSEHGFIFEECLTIHDIFIAGDRFSYLKERPITLDTLSRMPLIMLEPASNSRRRVERFFQSNGIALRPDIELGSHDLLTDFARIGLGAACVTREFVRLDGDLFEIQLKTPIPTRSIAICYSESIELPTTVKQFMELVKNRQTLLL